MLILLLLTTLLGGWVLVDAECPAGWETYAPDNTCLFVPGITKTFQDSIDYCDDLGANLVRLTSSSKTTFVSNLLAIRYYTFWLPIHDRDEDGDFTYLDGTPLGSYQSDWKDNGYYSISPENRCVARYYDVDHYWVNYRCDDVYEFVCEKDDVTIPICDAGWKLSDFGDVCIKVVQKRKKTFNGARAYCQDLGGDLATSVTSYRQRLFVTKQSRKAREAWIGVYSPGQDGTFQYVDDSPLVGRGPFKRGRPRDGSSNFCVILKKNKWFDKRCSRWLPFVCEKASTTI